MELYGVDIKQIYCFNNGKDYQSYNIFGAHKVVHNGKKGIRFLVYAPNAKKISVVGNFNSWNKSINPMQKVLETNCFICFIEGLLEGEIYKYLITTKKNEDIYKSDPYAFFSEVRPNTASIIYDLNGFNWSDGEYLEKRKSEDFFSKPKNIYEVHLGSFKQHNTGIVRKTNDDVPIQDFFTYEELSNDLIKYVKEMGYTHIEIMPVMEYPFDGSWGYQTTGYFSITSRYGTPKNFMKLINEAHKENIGVIVDWVPGHFCKDEHGLYRFDGGIVYDGRDHKHWGTTTFNYSNYETRSFLFSSAIFFIDKFHVDGIRFDGVSSMLYLNYGIEDEKEKIFNKYGDEGNLDAISFLQELNEIIGINYKGVMTIAEESTAWPNVTKSKEYNGLGFHYKWDMGWMHDTLNYMKSDFPYREKNHEMFSFSMMYANAENYVLALSHDEVVHGKASLINKMPGNYDEKFLQLKTLILYQMTRPGVKLNFMGYEIPEFIEWRYYEGLEWFLFNYEKHRLYNDYIKTLNNLYLSETSLYTNDMDIWKGFNWIDANDKKQNIFIYERIGVERNDKTIILLNFSKKSYDTFNIGVDRKMRFKEIMNTNDTKFGGDGSYINKKILRATNEMFHGKKYSIVIKVPALSGIIIKYMK